jgi:hypothetical protein
LKIPFPKSSFAASLRNIGLLTLYQWRENQCLSFYKNIYQHSDDKLRTLLPSAISHKFSLRNKRTCPIYTSAKLNDIRAVLSQSVLEYWADHRHNIIFYSTYHQYSLYYSSSFKLNFWQFLKNLILSL